MRKRLGQFIRWLQHYSGRWWYMPLLASLSAADAYIFVVSTEMLMLPNVVAKPKKWFRISLWFTIGSALGATSFAWLASHFGEQLVTHFFPHLLKSHEWEATAHFVSDYGIWGLALVSASPFPQHAAVAVAGLAHMKPWDVFGGVAAGRLAKYVFLCWAASHSPKILKRLHILPKEINGGSGGTKASE